MCLLYAVDRVRGHEDMGNSTVNSAHGQVKAAAPQQKMLRLLIEESHPLGEECVCFLRGNL